MSSYSDYMKRRAEKELEFFFGKIERRSNKYFRFNRYIDDDNVTIITNNIKVIKGNYVLLVDKNKAVYLKDWQVIPVHNYDLGINAYAVKLNRNYFKPYTFKFDFEDFIFEKEENFDDMVEIAKEQDSENLEISVGHMG